MENNGVRFLVYAVLSFWVVGVIFTVFEPSCKEGFVAMFNWLNSWSCIQGYTP